MISEKLKKFTTTQIIAYGFLTAIIIGTLLLMLPISTKQGNTTTFVDALFTATSSICVTGLTVVNTLNHWTTFGHAVILILIQFGGLGVVTFTTVVLMALGRRITLKERLLIQESYSLDTLKGLVKLTKKIIKGTFLVEGVGAFLYCFKFIPEFGLLPGIGKSIFNAVSAFCNAGMDILGDNSLAPYRSSILINLTTMGLIILGGIGFPVWWDVVKNIKHSFDEKFDVKRFFRKLMLHTKIVLLMTTVLIIAGAFLIFIMEYNNPKTIGELPFGEKALSSLFQSVTTRTAGFFTIPQENFADDSSFISILLMFIGGSPSGTAGGVKTATTALLLLATLSIIRGKPEVEAFQRKIPDGLIKKGLAVVLISFGVLVISTILLSVVEQAPFLDVLYEVTSALATVGLSKGLTPDLSLAGRIIITVTMYIGRIGPVTMALAFHLKREKGMMKHLPEEGIIVG